MKRRKIETFSADNTQFFGEQFGKVEDEFKKSIVRLIRHQPRPLRAYLSQIKLAGSNSIDVAICLASAHGEDRGLITNIADEFSRTFGVTQKLDILYVHPEKEKELRRKCCPFFTSERPSQPDFYLTSSEGYGLQGLRACYKERRLSNGHPDGYMLCEIEPSYRAAAAAEDLHKVILASRHSGHSIFSVNEWPVYVHVARVLRPMTDDQFIVAKNEMELLAWAELYESAAAARSQ